MYKIYMYVRHDLRLHSKLDSAKYLSEGFANKAKPSNLNYIIYSLTSMQLVFGRFKCFDRVFTELKCMIGCKHQTQLTNIA